ncbi:MAG: hypothetical protein ACT4PV_15235 [Planctomycetaceae bacterium]
MIGTMKPADYDKAVSLLRDLRDLAERRGRSEAIQDKVRGLRQRHAGKPSLLRRLNQSGL